MVVEEDDADDAPGDAAAAALEEEAKEELMIKPEALLSLRSTVLTLLDAMLEDDESATLSRMDCTLSLKSLANLAGSWYDEYSSLTTKRGVDEEKRKEAKLAMHAGFQAMLLLRRITDNVSRALPSLHMRRCPPIHWRIMRSMSAASSSQMRMATYNESTSACLHTLY